MKKIISYLFVFIFIISASLITSCTSEEANKEEVKKDALDDLTKSMDSLSVSGDSTEIEIQ
jgi:PBP1b-binding outer membrane lipoprotein LpoB